MKDRRTEMNYEIELGLKETAVLLVPNQIT